MLGAWSSETLQACHGAGVVALADALSLLHVGHSLFHGLQHLGLYYQNLLKCWWWRWVGVVVSLIGTMVASVGHQVTEKIFETEIDMAIRDSQLYASMYTDDCDFIYITKVRL
jgi:hypothetical protein